jgi:hypothetical protein
VRVTCWCGSQVIRQAELATYSSHDLHPQKQCNEAESRPLRLQFLKQDISIMADQIRAAPLVWINAFPGTGKYTIASILADTLMKDQCMLIHNHDLIDAVTLPRDHYSYRKLRKEERSKAFARHVLAPEIQGKCVIFTGMGAT